MIELIGFTAEEAREIDACLAGGPPCRPCRETAAERESEEPTSDGEVEQ